MIESALREMLREYQENENFAPKQNERDCPLTHNVKGQSEISSKEVK